MKLWLACHWSPQLQSFLFPQHHFTTSGEVCSIFNFWSVLMWTPWKPVLRGTMLDQSILTSDPPPFRGRWLLLAFQQDRENTTAGFDFHNVILQGGHGSSLFSKFLFYQVQMKVWVHTETYLRLWSTKESDFYWRVEKMDHFSHEFRDNSWIISCFLDHYICDFCHSENQEYFKILSVVAFNESKELSSESAVLQLNGHVRVRLLV